MTAHARLKTKLAGACTVQEAVTMHGALVAASRDALAQLPPPESFEVDLQEVTEIDACGCQLLAIFLENLKGHGITPKLCGLPAELREKMRLLGFQP